MKVKVLKVHIDKHENTLHKIGDVLEITKARLDELTAAGDFVEEIKAVKKTARK